MKLDLPSVRAALRGMFRVWPSSPADDELLASIDNVKAAAEGISRQESDFEETMRRVAGAMRP